MGRATAGHHLEASVLLQTTLQKLLNLSHAQTPQPRADSVKAFLFFARCRLGGLLCPCLPLRARSVLASRGGVREREKFDFGRVAPSQSACDRKADADYLPTRGMRICLAGVVAVRASDLAWRSASRKSTRQSPPQSTRSGADRKTLLATAQCPRCRNADGLLQTCHGKGLLVNDDSTTPAGQS